MPLTRSASKVAAVSKAVGARAKAGTNSKVAKAGVKAKVKTQPLQLSSPPETPAPEGRKLAKEESPDQKNKSSPNPASNTETSTISPASTRKRKRTPAKKEAVKKEQVDVNDDEIELPHGMGKVPRATQTTTSDETAKIPSPKRQRVNTEQKQRGFELQKLATEIGIPGHVEPRLDYLKYGHIPGQSPFPDLKHPQPAECKEVYNRLAALHGAVNLTDLLPPPSLERAGCGDVRSVIDALVRTYLSSNTSDRNSSVALKGMIEHFGTSTSGSNKGSPDYVKIHAADQMELEKAIQNGGMGHRKSMSIKALLDMVYAENMEWREGLGADSRLKLRCANDETHLASNPEEAAAIALKDLRDNPLALQYVSLLPTQDAILHMVKYPGIGLKTAACVALYCLRRQVFPVDTHVQRICQGLGWTQVGCNENKTFSHCDALMPDEFKYGLHDLFVKHGKACGRCKAGATEKSERWEEGCPLEEFIDRDRMANHKLKEKKMRVQDDRDVAKEEGEEAGGEENDAVTPASARKVKSRTKADAESPIKKPKDKKKKVSLDAEDGPEQSQSESAEDAKGRKSKTAKNSKAKGTPSKAVKAGKQKAGKADN